MTKINVLIDYSRVPDMELDNFAQSVYNSLNPNANFTWQATTMPALLSNITNFRTKLEIAKTGTSKDVTAKNVAKKALTEMLRAIAMDVNKQGNSDLLKLQSSGFQLAKERSKVGVLPKPTGFKVSTGANSGELLFTVDANTSAKTYNFYTAPVPVPANISDWRLTVSTTRKKNVTGYTPGKQYECKCAYQGSEEVLIFSDSVTIYAQ